MTESDIAAAAEVGVVIGVTDIDEGIRGLQQAGMAELAAWLRLAKIRWSIKEKGATTMSYLVFNPKTGQHIRATTQQEAIMIRDQLVALQMEEVKALHSALLEEEDSEGNAVTTPVVLP